MDAHAFRVFEVEEMLRVAETEPRFLMDEHAFQVCEVHAFRVFEVEEMLCLRVSETEPWFFLWMHSESSKMN